MRILTGTSGFSYRAWKGTFYPPDLPSHGMLRWYAARLETVEANATFYRMPRPETLAAWRGEVPAGFAFSVKAPRRITHVQRLRGVEGVVAAFRRAVAELGPSLGAVLVQLPPTLRRDVPLLREFLALWPPGGRAALEFRHPSWHTEEVHQVLADHGAALCVAEDELTTTPIAATASFGYLRLRRPAYRLVDLQAWAHRILEQRWTDAYVYFKHEDEARGPALALALRDVLGPAGGRAAPDPALPHSLHEW